MNSNFKEITGLTVSVYNDFIAFKLYAHFDYNAFFMVFNQILYDHMLMPKIEFVLTRKVS